MTHFDWKNLPAELNLTHALLFDRLESRAERVALRLGNQTWTYAQLAEDVNRLSGVLRARGLRAGDRVLLVLPDGAAFATSWLAAVKMGCVVAAVPANIRAAELSDYLAYVQPSLCIVSAEAATKLSARSMLISQAPADHPLSFECQLARAIPDASFAPTGSTSPAAWLFTSGSTGRPKAAVHAHGDFLFNALTYAQSVVGFRAEDICLATPKLAFGYALGTNLLFPLLAGASSVLFPEPSTPERILELLRQHRPSLLTAVPTSLSALLNTQGLDPADFSSLRICLSAGEALPAEVYGRWKQRTGVDILDGIGSAEMFHIFISNRVGDIRPGSVGRVVDGYEAKVCDERGCELPSGEVGRLWVRGGSIASEYFSLPEETQRTFRSGYCVSSDHFRQDAEGYFYFCGREDDLLKIQGRWVSTLEVENALLSHRAVGEAAVIGIKNAMGLPELHAFVALQPSFPADAKEPLTEALKEHVRGLLPSFKTPRTLHYLEELPKSDRGKVLKSRLSDGTTPAFAEPTPGRVPVSPRDASS